KGLAEKARGEILTVVSDHAEKGIVGLDDGGITDLNALAGDLPYVGSNDIGVDEPANLRLPFGDIAVQPGILERGCRLRSKEFQRGNSRWREDARCKIVFEIENADELALVDQWQTE